ncbi:aspartate-semialdehyde dehydrogenase [Buchnera aphidicola]|uniref:Aspartate-semialdehyde dehydrogenase n=1 Tax=Buchnera aphidicola (Sarucallis kahawaluokalani) TaxID=1241878 RepID=A0A4D6YJL5_9GAMM|nr:aspartate-semialdehyde dehydrogenase [Buchnera aphidicola]QCI26080.1 aspartate-semialdehyde dehydrogenase [Buchnera aphidicola (Sarucallis kahawaluokalani)]
MKMNVGFIGWRGMVGSVLMQRMLDEGDFKKMHPIFFSTSEIGTSGPNIQGENILQDAYNIDCLKNMNIILSCQGGEYTNHVYNKLRQSGWNGYWIDAASVLRMHENALIVLDPINLQDIYFAIQSGIKTFVGGNCTVSLMLMALGGLFFNNLIDWILFSTYQAASGAGSKHILELIKQMGYLYNIVKNDCNNIEKSIIDIEKKMSQSIYDKCFPKKEFRAPLAGNVLPWIDYGMKNYQTKEEWKVQAEANKILQKNQMIPIDGTCVRIGAFRCHSQSFTIKLKKDLSYNNIINIIQEQNSWVKIIPNDFESTINLLTPYAVTGTLNIAVGRIRKLNIDSNLLSIFTVGDQLLWGAAEPLRRTLMIILNT